MSYLDMYLIVKLDDFHRILKFICGFIGFLGLAMSVIVRVGIEFFKVDTDGGLGLNLTTVTELTNKVIKISTITLITCVTLTTALPTTKQLAAIYVVPNIVNNENIKQIPDKLLQLGNSWIDKTIDSLMEDVDKEIKKR